MSQDLPTKIRERLAKPNPAVMATLGKDGRPVTVATWYLLEDDGTILLGLDATRARLKHLQRDPRVSLTVINEANWYQHTSLQGQVGEIHDDVELRQIDRLAQLYLGKPYPDRESPRVFTHMSIERWHSWSA